MRWPGTRFPGVRVGPASGLQKAFTACPQSRVGVAQGKFGGRPTGKIAIDVADTWGSNSAILFAICHFGIARFAPLVPMPPKVPPASPVQPKSPAAPGPPSADTEDLSRIREALDKREGDSDRVVSIPIWGWTGDGKTCALLTAIHYCDPAAHLLELALITDTEDLARMEGSVEQYRGLNLAAVAASTTDRLRQLMKNFIDEAQWLPGTDEASAYVVEARNMAARLGYVVFPDIRGGSFREMDDTAKEILNRAHAAILLVNAQNYALTGTEGKRYRSEILTRLQHFARAKIPVCVMITKADKHPGADPTVDTTHSQLTVVVDRQAGLEARVCRVSVSGNGKPCSPKKPPPMEERTPEQLLSAWMWVVGKALLRPIEEVRNVLPSVNLQGLIRRAAPVALEALPELRPLGEFSNAPGIALCPTGDNELVFLAESGDLLEASFEAGRREPTISQVASLKATDEELQGFYFKGEFVVGKRGECNSVWHGSKGGALTEAPLPSALLSWVAVSARRIVGIDASGRLHSCGLSAGKWTQLDYLEGLAAPSNLAVCAYSSPSSQAVVYTGDAVEVVQLGGDGKFREKVAPAVTCKFTAPGAVTNSLGLCFALTTGAAGVLSASGKVGDLGVLHPETPLALATNAPVAAALDAQLHLTAFTLSGGKLRKTAAAQSPLLPGVPTGLLWSSNGSIVVATFDDSTWAAYRPLALG